MVAVVVPPSSRRHHEGPATSKGYQYKSLPKSMRQVSNNQDRNLPGSTTQNVDNNWSESGTSGTSEPSDNTDDAYTASSDNGDSVKQPSKRRKLSSRPSAPRSRRPRSRSGVARVRCRLSRVQPGAPQSSTRASHERCTHSRPVASGGAEQTLDTQRLSPEDVSALVSALTEKLLNILRGSSTDAMRAADEGVAVVDTESGRYRECER
ncbi:hypothetical protein FQN50_009554 [Emmonsiellopsis sp. PD_5]|nr:hypothetical protein FQN50_009554 [Emmonsiellopsis sp. PD_5]